MILEKLSLDELVKLRRAVNQRIDRLKNGENGFCRDDILRLMEPGKEYRASDLGEEEVRVRNTFRELLKDGKIERVKVGTYVRKH